MVSLPTGTEAFHNSQHDRKRRYQIMVTTVCRGQYGCGDLIWTSKGGSLRAEGTRSPIPSGSGPVDHPFPQGFWPSNPLGLTVTTDWIFHGSTKNGGGSLASNPKLHGAQFARPGGAKAFLVRNERCSSRQRRLHGLSLADFEPIQGCPDRALGAQLENQSGRSW
jgi:hypothetical protein